MKNARMRIGGRVVDGARLESVYRGNSIVGSNPTRSAILSFTAIQPSPLNQQII